MQFKKIIVSSDNVATNPWPGSKLLGCIVECILNHTCDTTLYELDVIFQVQCGAASPIPASYPRKL